MDKDYPVIQANGKPTPRAGRFFDDGDFTAAHDDINAWVMLGGWKKIAAQIWPGYEWFTGTYDSEPPLDGHPTVYPDGIVHNIQGFNDHRATPQSVQLYKEHGRHDVSLHCGVCRQGQPDIHIKRPVTLSPYLDKGWAEWIQEIATTLPGPTETCATRLGGLCVEIKGAVPTFGDVMRQLKIYSNRMPGNSRMVLVTPETKFDEVFTHQGIHVAHPADLGYER